MTHMTRRYILQAMSATSLAAALPVAQAQSFPDKPVRVIVPFAAGNTLDTALRQVAEEFKKNTSQPLVVENKPGGSGIIAAQSVMAALADGYTLLLANTSMLTINPHTFAKLPYDAEKTFRPITNFLGTSMVMAVNASVPANNVKEFVAYAKANPGKLGFGSGTGSARLASEMLKTKTGIDILNVPYKSNVQALTDLRGGQIQILLGDIALMLPQIRAGAVKGLAVSSARRSAAMPDMPTLQEAGVSDYELVGFIAAFAPAKTPESIVRRLNEEMVKILKDKEFADSLAASGVDAAPTTPGELREWVISETKKWHDLARAAGIQPE